MFLIFYDFKFQLLASNSQLISLAQISLSQTPDSQTELPVQN